MFRWLAFFVQSAQVACLALMSGGMVALGAFVAPAVFRTLPHVQAAPLMATVFGRFDQALFVFMGVTLVLEVVLWAVCPVLRRAGKGLLCLRVLSLLLLAVCVSYSTQVLNPQIAVMNQAGVRRADVTSAGKAFDRIHKQSEKVYKVQCINALLALVLIVGSLSELSSKRGKA